MKCSNCGAEITGDSKFCVKCGAKITSDKSISKKSVNNKKNDFIQVILTCLLFILNVILKPVSTLKEKVKDYSNIKTTGILVGVVAFGRMIINLLGNMISVVFVKKYTNYYSSETKLVFNFENLKELDYFSLIVKELFGFVIVVAALALIYYLVALVMKKNANYFRLTAIATVSFIPVIIIGSFVSVIVNYIYAPLSIFLVFASLIYSLLTFINACDDELSIDDSNLKVYFHTICLTVVIIVVYYVAMNSVGNSLVDLLK